MNTKTLFTRFFILISIVALNSCTSSEDEGLLSPTLPPVSTMVMDFGNFNQQTKSSVAKDANAVVGGNWAYSAITVGVWNTVLVTTLAVPVAAFNSALKHKATFIGNATWEWKFTVDGFTSQYSARLTGELVVGEIVWKMYIKKTGIGAFNEFMWYSGTSKTDGKSGQWVLNHSAAFPDKMLQIDWTKDGQEIASIKYTYLRDKTDQGGADAFKNSYITYGLQAGAFNVFYNIHAYDYNKTVFVNSDIEWNRTTYNGRVKAPSFFGNSNWQCWNNIGENMTCP